MSDSPLMTLRFELPWPPSVNHYWQHIVLGGKFKKARVMVFLSDAGKKYRIAALQEIAAQHVPRDAVQGRLGVRIVAYPPDRRGKRDLDNLWKGVLDSLVHARVIADDGDFDDEHIVRGQIRAGGRLSIELRELGTVVCVQPTLDLRPPASAAPPF